MDPAEVRRRNFIAKDAFPHTTATGATYDSGDYEGALDLALALGRLRRAARRAAAAPRRRAATKQLGIGVSLRTSRSRTRSPRPSSARSRSPPDGGAIVRTGSFSHGQGHETTFAMIAAERLGLPLEKITVAQGRHGRRSPTGTGTYGSKSPQIGGTAARLRRRRRSSSRRSSSSPTTSRRARTDVVLDPGARPLPRRRHARARRSPGPSSPTRAAGDGRLGELKAAQRVQGRPDLPLRRARRGRRGRHRDRGRSSCSGWSAVDDAGTLINPLHRRGPGARRHRDRRRAGALRAVRLRRGRHAADGQLRRLRVPVRRRAAVVGDGRDGDADAGEPARREGHRRVGDDRLDAGRPQRRRSTRSRRSACATSTCRRTARTSGARSRRRRHDEDLDHGQRRAARGGRRAAAAARLLPARRSSG